MIISNGINERHAELNAFILEHFGLDEPVPGTPPVEIDYVHREMIPDEEVIAKIGLSRQAKSFDRLYSGDITGYPSQSEADLVIHNSLAFWTGKNPEQMDRLFRESGLFRPKWDERRGAQTYGEMTIEKAIKGCKEVYGGNPSLGIAPVKRQGPIDPAQLLEAYAVGQDYVDKLGNEGFLFNNLIIKQHVVTIIAESGGGKTTFFFRYVAPHLAKQGLQVVYIDADSPPSEHRDMKTIADEHGFKFLNSDANQGTSIEGLLDLLKEIADSDTDLPNWVIFFDTLKKMADLLQKNSVKKFYVLCRKLAAKGATIVLLGHANKFRDKEGHLVFEGVGDVKSDSDELILLERVPNQDGGIDVTTVVDSSKGAKVRGIFKPISFHISPEREITLLGSALKLPDLTTTGAIKATNEEILTAATDYLSQCSEPVKQKDLARHVADVTGAGQKRVRSLIISNSAQKGLAEAFLTRFVYTKGERNTFLYELPQVGVSPDLATASKEGIDTDVDTPTP